MGGRERDGTAAADDAAAVFRYSVTGRRLQLAGLIAAGVVVAFLVYDHGQPIMRWSGLALAAGLVGGGAFLLLKPFDPATVADYTLTIDRDGIACGRLYAGKVPWSEISYAHVKRTGTHDSRKDFLVVAVHDPARYPPAGGRLDRIVSVLETASAVSLDLAPLDGTPSQIEAALDRFQPRPTNAS